MLKQIFFGVLAVSILAAPAAAGNGRGNGHGGHKSRVQGSSHHLSYGKGYSGHRVSGYRSHGRSYSGHRVSGHGYSGHGYRGHGYGFFGYGHGHGHGHGGYYGIDDEAFIWLGLTALGLKVLDLLDHQQQRRFEEAQRQAATAPIGQSIVWTSGDTAGTVTPVREGTDDTGHLCREFQQEIRIDGRIERASGIACRQADGSWQVVK